MDADELLLLHPRETLRWLRGRLGLSQLALALELDVGCGSVSGWESRRSPISPQHRARLAALLAPHLATPEGRAFARSLGRGEEG